MLPSLVMLAVAGGGAVAAIAATRNDGNPGRKVIVAVSPLRAIPPPAPTPSETTPTQTKRKSKTKTPRALISWPRTNGYTIILASLPQSGGAAAAKKRALAALKDGLRHVGVLVSSSYPSLHPGYYIVFTGVYESLEYAQAALPAARRYSRTAYARPIAR